MGRINANALNGEPGADRHIVARKGLIAAVNERPASGGRPASFVHQRSP